MSAKAIFLDKDGTLVHDVPYNIDPARIRLTPGAGKGLAILQRAGYRLIVVSNQSGVARGYFGEEALVPVQARLSELLASHGVTLDGFYYCPHHPQGSVLQYAVTCACRKPAPGLLRLAAEELDLALAESWMIGDILDDVEAGHRAGCRTILIDNGNETEWILSSERHPDYTTSNLGQAAQLILKNERMHGMYGWGVEADSNGTKA